MTPAPAEKTPPPTPSPTVRFHADDLGLHPAVDRAVFRAFEAGAIAGASILVTGETFDVAARQARAVGLPLALHLAVVDTGPLSSPAEVPSLVGRDGRFPPFLGPVALQHLLRRVRTAELRLEVRRQLERFAEAGLMGPDGMLLDGHQHLHVLPAVFAGVLELADEFPIAAFRLPLRSPFERRRLSPRSLAFGVVEVLGRRARSAAARRGIRVVPCWGVLYAGRLTPDLARGVLGSLPAGADGQLLCHPGDDDHALAAARRWGYAWEQELATVLSLAGRAAC